MSEKYEFYDMVRVRNENIDVCDLARILERSNMLTKQEEY